jgi:hypothetical protein
MIALWNGPRCFQQNHLQATRLVSVNAGFRQSFGRAVMRV